MNDNQRNIAKVEVRSEMKGEKNITAVKLTFEGITLTQTFIKPVDKETADAFFGCLHSQFEQHIVEECHDICAGKYSTGKRMTMEHNRRAKLDQVKPEYVTTKNQ